MRRISQLIFTACATAAMAFGPDCDACTNVLVTKGASADGSNIISYAADSHQLFGELYWRESGTAETCAKSTNGTAGNTSGRFRRHQGHGSA